MLPLERRATFSLASIFALRMLGLFLVLPVFALEARKLPGGDDVQLVGLAMGVYGLTQGILQIPFGTASDRFGRKRVMVHGTGHFCHRQCRGGVGADAGLAGGGACGAGCGRYFCGGHGADCGPDPRQRAHQGHGAGGRQHQPGVCAFAGAIAAAQCAAGFAGLVFYHRLPGQCGHCVVLWWVPPEPAVHAAPGREGLGRVLRDAALLRLDAGAFILHAVQFAMWMAVPAMLVQAGLEKARTGRCICRPYWARLW